MPAGAQLDLLQRELSAVQHESMSLRHELQARERLLLELQDKVGRGRPTPHSPCHAAQRRLRRCCGGTACRLAGPDVHWLAD